MMTAFDLVGRTKFPRGPHAATGRGLGSPGLCDVFKQNESELANTDFKI